MGASDIIWLDNQVLNKIVTFKRSNIYIGSLKLLKMTSY